MKFRFKSGITPAEATGVIRAMRADPKKRNVILDQTLVREDGEEVRAHLSVSDQTLTVFDPYLSTKIDKWVDELGMGAAIALISEYMMSNPKAVEVHKL
jgi:hypothetical protein